MKNKLLFIGLMTSILTININYKVEDQWSELTAERIEIAEHILTKLKKVKGLNPADSPHLKVVEELPELKFNLAMAKNSEGMIYLQEKTLNLCFEKLGKESKNGLAYILAHELSHITREHNVRHRFIKKFSKDISEENEFRDNVKKMIDKASTELEKFMLKTDTLAVKYRIRKNEAEADFDAGFTSYLAGYPTKIAGPLFLETAYDSFNIERSAGSYASLEERKEILFQTGKEIDTLIHVFEMGNYLTTVKEYDAAYECYNVVSKKFKSAELLNNIGVISLLELSESIKVSKLKYALPITLDFTELGHRDAALEARKELFNKQLYLCNDAIRYFNQATDVNPNYHISYLNKSIAYYLLNVVKNREQNFAEFIGDELTFSVTSALRAKQILESKPIIEAGALSNVYTQLSIAYHAQKLNEQAKIHLDKAFKLDSLNIFVLENQKVIDGNSDVSNFLKKQKQSTDSKCINNEVLFGSMTIEDVLNDKIENNWTMSKVIKSEKGMFLNTLTKVEYFEGNDFIFYNIVKLNELDRLRRDYSFFTTKKNYTGTTVCGDLSLNDNRASIEVNYGNASTELAIGEGSLMRFSKGIKKEEGTNSGILFSVDKNKINSWTVYEVIQ